MCRRRANEELDPSYLVWRLVWPADTSWGAGPGRWARWKALGTSGAQCEYLATCVFFDTLNACRNRYEALRYCRAGWLGRDLGGRASMSN
jgi:hypothetical protein